jgi:hypothetical protein
MRGGVYKDLERRSAKQQQQHQQNTSVDLDRQLHNIQMLNQQAKLEDSLKK